MFALNAYQYEQSSISHRFDVSVQKRAVTNERMVKWQTIKTFAADIYGGMTYLLSVMPTIRVP